MATRAWRMPLYGESGRGPGPDWKGHPEKGGDTPGYRDPDFLNQPPPARGPGTSGRPAGPSMRDTIRQVNFENAHKGYYGAYSGAKQFNLLDKAAGVVGGGVNPYVDRPQVNPYLEPANYGGHQRGGQSQGYYGSTSRSDGGPTYDPGSQYGYRIPAHTADQLNKMLTKEQFDYFRTNYAPREMAFIGSVLDGSYFRGAAEDAGGVARGAFDQSAAISDRAVERYGAQATAQQKALIKNLRAHSKSLAGTQAENTTRDMVDSVRMDVLSELTNIGRGVRGSALQGASQLAQLQAQRDAANRQLSAGRSAARFGGAAAGAMMGWSLGGPIGAGIGAIGGFLLG